MSIGKKTLLLISLVILADQISKIWVKTHFALGESVELTGWFQFLFVENNGMAFGMELIGKLFLTLFRIIAVGGIGYLIYRLIKQKKYPQGFVLCTALIFAGALGNIIDSVAYGVIFGYAPLFYGKVVDMLYFPLFTFPDWLPLLGGQVFFSPVFNLADSVITVGIALLLLFYRSFLSEKKSKNAENP